MQKKKREKFEKMDVSLSQFIHTSLSGVCSLIFRTFLFFLGNFSHSGTNFFPKKKKKRKVYKMTLSLSCLVT